MTQILLAVSLALAMVTGPSPATRVVTVHGHAQTLHLYGDPAARVAIVSSGDGGWVHLAPHVAEYLAGHGWYVIGFDARAYLEGCSDGGHAVTADEVARDYATLLPSTTGAASTPLLVGVSEGAGLSIVAAADPAIQQRISGVIALGLGDLNERAWHWRDSIIYVTKGVPREPVFHASEFVSHVAPVPLAFLRSTSDEFVSGPESDRLAALARTPTRMWTVRAADHRFSDNLPGLDASLAGVVEWIASVPRSE